MKKRNGVILLVFVAAVICTAIAFFAFHQSGNGQKSPIIYLTAKNELIYLKSPSADAVQLSSFGSSGISGYYNDDEDCVFYSGDGQTLYYFDLSKGLYDDGGAPLCCVDTASLDEGQLMPKMIDEYAIMNRVETSYVMEPLDGGGLIYMGVDYAQQCYALKYFDGNSSSILVEGREIYVTFNSDKTFANLCVYHDTGAVDDWSWYRMTINEYPVTEYVCDGTIYPLQDIYSEQDFQMMAENDIIICMSEYEYDYGYYTVDLYVHGQWRENLIEKLPWFSKGPFGIEVGAGVSFFVISTADMVTTTGQNYQGDSQQWSFFRYERGRLNEVNEALRFQMNLPDNALLRNSIYCINGEVLFRYNPEHVEGHPLGWMTFDKTGEIAEINDDLRHYWESTSVLTNKEGASILLYCGYNEESYVLYAYSDGKVKKLIDTPHSLDFWLYERNSETYLVAYTDQAVYSINASDVNIDTIEDVFSPIEMSENVRGAIPYSNNDILYILSGGTLSHWNGKKSETICAYVRFVWSDYQRIIQNNPRIY